jgi:hypothetical protein
MCNGDTLIGKALGTSTSAENNINKSIQQFSGTLLSEAKTVFGDANQTFNTLSGQATSIFNGGPSQLGWSAGQVSATNAGIVNNAATAERNLKGAVVGGSAPGVGGTENPNFVNAEANLQNQQAVAENQATQEDYAQGNKNWQTSAGILQNAPSVFNAAQGYNSEAASELNTAQKSQTALDKQNNWQGGLIKSGLNMAADFATGGVSGAVGAGLGNMSSDSSLGENLGNFWSGAINPGGTGTMPGGAGTTSGPNGIGMGQSQE